MNCERNERLGYYVSMAMEASCCDIAAQYDSLDTTGIRIGKRLDRLVYRAIAKAERRKTVAYRPYSRRRAVVLVAVIAALLALLLSLSVAAVQEGTGIWNAVLQWYEDHIRVDFGTDVEMDSGIETTPSVFITENRLPVVTDMDLRRVNYGFDIRHYQWAKYGYANAKGEIVCYYWQAAWVYSLDPLEVEDFDKISVSVNGFDGDLYRHPDTGEHILVWHDGVYRYRLESHAFDMKTLVAMAESVEAGRGMMPEDTLQGAYLPTVLPEGVEQEITLLDPFTLRAIYTKDGRVVCEYLQHPLNKNLQSEEYYGKRVGFFGINGYLGRAALYPYGGGTLSWQDDKNGYMLWSADATFEDMLAIAASIRSVGTAAPCLEEIHLIKNLSENISWQIEKQSEKRIDIGYYRDGEQLARLYQMTIDETVPVKKDAEYMIENVTIHDRDATLRCYEDGSFCLIFDDGIYRYALESQVLRKEQLCAWALTVSPPETVEQPYKPSAVPSSWTETCLERDEMVRRYAYYDGENELLTFSQFVLWGSAPTYGRDCTAEDIYFGGQSGILLRYMDGRLLLVWNDGSYRYEMGSSVLTAQELIAYAESVMPYHTVVEGAPTRIEQIRTPQMGTDGLEAVVVKESETELEIEYRLDGETVGKFTQRLMSAETIWNRDNTATVWIRVVDGKLQYRYIHEDNRQIHNWTDGEYQYILEMRGDYQDRIDLMVGNTR